MHTPLTRTLFLATLCCTHALTVSAQSTTPADGLVTLPVEEYRQLRDKAVPRPGAASKSTATLSRIDYELTAERGMASGRALLTLDAVGDGWTRLAIPAGLMAREARIDGQPALISGQPPGILLSKPGRSVLTLDIAVPIVSSSGSDAITLPVTQAAVSSVALRVAKSGVVLAPGDGFVAEQVDSANETRWTVFAKAQQPITLSWKQRGDTQRSEQPLRTRAQVGQLVELGEDTSQVTATIRIEVPQGLARDVAVAVPSGVTVNQVDGPTVAEWSVSANTLLVRFLDPVTTDVSFVVQAEARLPRDGVVSIPLFRVPGAEREGGTVGIDVLGAGEIGQQQTRNFEATDAADLGDVAKGRTLPSLVAFRAKSTSGHEPKALSVNVVRYTPQAVLVASVDDARYRTSVSEDGRQLVEGRYTIRNNQRGFLKVSLPQGSTLWSASVADRPVRPGIAGDALLLPLEKGRTGGDAPAFVVSIVYLQQISRWDTAGTLTLALPELDLPISRTGVEFYHSPRYRVDVIPGAFRQEESLPLATESLFRRKSPAAETAGRMANGIAGGIVGGLEAAPPPVPPQAQAIQRLAERFRNEGGGRTVVGTLPVDVAFPSVGARLFLASELTPESTAAAAELTFKRIVK